MSSIRQSLGEGGTKLSQAEFLTKANQLTQDTVKSLAEIWQSAGYEETECKGLLGDLFTKLKKVVDQSIGLAKYCCL